MDKQTDRKKDRDTTWLVRPYHDLQITVIFGIDR